MLLYRNPSLQFWLRGRQNPVQFLISPHLIILLLTQVFLRAITFTFTQVLNKLLFSSFVFGLYSNGVTGVHREQCFQCDYRPNT